MKQKKYFITSDDILGKDVIDNEGEIIGVSSKIHIDNRNKQIIGLTIDQGFMKPDLYVGLEYVETFGIDSIMLKTSPKSKVRGLNVLDNDGKKIGHVSNILSLGKTNRFRGIFVKKAPLSKPFIIKSSDIKEIGYSVILKKEWTKHELKGGSSIEGNEK
jgi:sporulation protein YlmC with PRC-barrel domain